MDIAGLPGAGDGAVMAQWWRSDGAVMAQWWCSEGSATVQ